MAYGSSTICPYFLSSLKRGGILRKRILIHLRNDDCLMTIIKTNKEGKKNTFFPVTASGGISFFSFTSFLKRKGNRVTQQPCHWPRSINWFPSRESIQGALRLFYLVSCNIYSVNGLIFRFFAAEEEKGR